MRTRVGVTPRNQTVLNSRRAKEKKSAEIADRREGDAVHSIIRFRGVIPHSLFFLFAARPSYNCTSQAHHLLMCMAPVLRLIIFGAHSLIRFRAHHQVTGPSRCDNRQAIRPCITIEHSSIRRSLKPQGV